MKMKTIKKILIAILVSFAIIMTSSISFAGITPSQITGESDGELDLNFLDTLTNAIRTIGIFIAVGALMIIGIKYVMGSIEEKANYKKSMMPYVIGCFVLFGASIIAPELEKLVTNMGTDTETIGNTVLGFIQVIGTFATIGVLMVLGIKYMVGSTEERASYKRSMLPYVVGCVLIFATVNIAGMMYDFSANSFEGVKNAGTGKSAAEQFLKTAVYENTTIHNVSQIQNEMSKISEMYLNDPSQNTPGVDSDEYKYWKAYYDTLKKWVDSAGVDK